MPFVQVYQGLRSNGVTAAEMNQLTQAVAEAEGIIRNENGEVINATADTLDLFMAINRDIRSFAYNRPEFEEQALGNFQNFFSGVDQFLQHRCQAIGSQHWQHAAGLTFAGGISVSIGAVLLLPGWLKLIAIIPGVVTIGAGLYHQHVHYNILPEYCRY
ncbi:MAG: hypothetical protein ABH859_03435 [Pseudomonadota bacterium]